MASFAQAVCRRCETLRRGTPGLHENISSTLFTKLERSATSGTMERARLHELWPYLPAFRAVAETEHLPSAAERLHVVPSALSRSVHLLEGAIGEPLFLRRGRRLVLNAAGRALLDAVRRAMCAIERGVAGEGARLEGELTVGTIGVLTHHVLLPELLALAERHPGLVPVMRNHGPREAHHRLLLGALDLAFYCEPVVTEGVESVRLGALRNGIYCGRGHALFERRRVRRADLLDHAFSVPGLGDRLTPMDGWPVELQRRVGFRIELLLTNLEVALSGRFLGVLPDIVAHEYVAAGRLRRFSFDLVPDTEVYGAHREGEADGTLTRALFDAVRTRVARAARPGVGPVVRTRPLDSST